MSLLHPQDAEDKMTQAFGCILVGVVIAAIGAIAFLVKVL